MRRIKMFFVYVYCNIRLLMYDVEEVFWKALKALLLRLKA